MIHYEILGQGSKTIVMLHGWAMHSGMWRQFAEMLSEQYRVICIDLPGHGLSPEIECFELDAICQQIAPVLQGKQVSLLGWSMGALVAIRLARLFPDQVESLLLLAANPKFVASHHWHGVSEETLQQFSKRLIKNCQLTLMQFLSIQVLGLDQAKSILKQLKHTLLMVDTPSVSTLEQGLCLLMQADLRQELLSLSLPVCFILGEKDSLIPVAVAEDLKHLDLAIKIHIIKDAGHIPFITHPDSLKQTIQSFYEAHR